MTLSERQYIQDLIESQGFDCGLIEYGTGLIKHVQDEEFHRLRNTYVAAQKALSLYIGEEDI